MFDAFFERMYFGPVKTIEEVKASLLENISSIEIIIERINTAGAGLPMKEELLSICLEMQKAMQIMEFYLNNRADKLNESSYLLKRLILFRLHYLNSEDKKQIREIERAVDGKISILDIISGVFFWCKIKCTRRAA